MTELELLRELADETALPEPTELAAARARLMHAMPSERGSVAGPLNWRAARTRRPSRRLHLVAATVSVAAAAAVAFMTLGGDAHSIHSPVRSNQTVAGALGRHFPALTHPTAKEILQRAAFVALQTTAATPSPDQFVYTENGGAGGQTTQSWMSVDGLQASRVGNNTFPPCLPGHFVPGELVEPGSPLYVPGDGGRVPCTPQPAYFPDMPTQADGMLAYLEQTQGVRGDDNADDLNDLGKQVGYMLSSYYLLPAQQAALYEFLAQTPGITAQTGVTDVTGRPGIGVVWSFEGGGGMLIFNPQTYSFLGCDTRGIGGQIRGTALLTTAIVDHIGQLPDQSTTPSANNAT
jgi:hypothetical protein